jgi:hypothetical protein
MFLLSSLPLFPLPSPARKWQSRILGVTSCTCALLEPDPKVRWLGKPLAGLRRKTGTLIRDLSLLRGGEAILECELRAYSPGKHLSDSFSPFCSGLFWKLGLTNFLPGLELALESVEGSHWGKSHPRHGVLCALKKGRTGITGSGSKSSNQAAQSAAEKTISAKHWAYKC